MVGLKEDLLKMADENGYLPLHHAARNCPDNDVFKFMIDVHPQALVTMCRLERCVPLHMLLKCNYRSGALRHFLIDQYLHSMDCVDKRGSKSYFNKKYVTY